MARPRKPEQLRLLHGDKQNRFNPDEPQPAAGEPAVPADLSEAQRIVWDDVTGHLRVMGMLSAADQPVILAYVVIVEKLDRLSRRMTDEPEVVRNPSNGMPMQNPVFDQWLKAVSKMESLGTKLGMTPSARSGIRSKAAAATPAGGPERLFGR